MKNLVIFSLVFFTCLGQSNAQKFGGSAHVLVKDSQGNTRVLVATVQCDYSNKSYAKSSLENILETQANHDEDFASGIYYDIDECKEDDNKEYGGSAWVDVKDEEGEKRIITTTVGCDYGTIPRAKSALHNLIKGKAGHQKFVSEIHFDIDECDE